MRSSTVAEIDEQARSFERLPDRPDGRSFVRRPRAPKDPEKTRAAQRLRSRVWRQANDRKGRPTSDQIAAALLNAVCRSEDFSELMDSDVSVVRVAVNDLVDRGFKLKEILDMLRKVRRRHVDAANRTAKR